MRWLFQTDDSTFALIARIGAGLVLFPHGAQKLLGWFGGYGFSGTMGFLTGQIGLPAPVALLVILAESVGAVLLVAGLLTRVWAFLLSATMIGAMVTMHAPYGFFMDWGGTQGGHGIEFNLLVLAVTVPLAIFGAGRASVDRWIAQRADSAPAVARRQAHA